MRSRLEDFGTRKTIRTYVLFVKPIFQTLLASYCGHRLNQARNLRHRNRASRLPSPFPIAAAGPRASNQEMGARRVDGASEFCQLGETLEQNPISMHRSQRLR